MFTCMSCARSSGSTNRVVAQAPFVPGIRPRRDVGVARDERGGAACPSSGSYALRIQWKLTSSVARRSRSTTRRPRRGTRSRPPRARAAPPRASSVSSPVVTNTTPSTPSSGSGRSAPPPGAISTMSWAKVVANPAIGRARIHDRVLVKPGRLLVTMSRSTPLGMTVYASVTIARSVSSSVCAGSPPRRGVVAHGPPRPCRVRCGIRSVARRVAGGRARRARARRCPVSAATSSAAIAPHRTPRSTNPASARIVAGSSSTAPVVPVGDVREGGRMPRGSPRGRTRRWR